jgi:hypothetical protein
MTCPRCGEELQAAAKVCRHCLYVLDREAWQQHDAGRLGADDRGGGQPLEDPTVGPLPLTGSGVTGGPFGAFGGALRLIGAAVLLRPRRGRGRG